MLFRSIRLKYVHSMDGTRSFKRVEECKEDFVRHFRAQIHVKVNGRFEGFIRLAVLPSKKGNWVHTLSPGGRFRTSDAAVQGLLDTLAQR